MKKKLLTSLKKFEIQLLLLTFFALVLRLLLWWIWDPVISRDTVEYLRAANHYSEGNFGQALRHFYPPGYPLAIAAFLKAGLFPETAARMASLFFGVLLVLVTGVLLRPWGKDWALAGAFLMALQPYGIRYGIMGLSESTFACGLIAGWLLFLWGLAKRKYRYFLLASLVLSFSYLTRPEGIILLGLFCVWSLFSPRLQGWRQRLLCPLCLLSVSMAMIIPYLVVMKSKKVTGVGKMARDKGEWKITLKGGLYRSLFRELIKESPEKGKKEWALTLPRLKSFGKKLAYQGGKNTLRWMEITHPVLALFFLIGLVKLPRGGREFAFLFVATLLCYLGAYSLIRVSSRLVFPMALLAQIPAAYGLTFALKRGEKKRWKLAFLAIIVVTTLPVGLRPLGTDQAHLREAGKWIRSQKGTGAVLYTLDKRVGFYSGIETYFYLPQPQKSDPKSLRDFARHIDHLLHHHSKEIDYVVVNQCYTDDLKPHEGKILARFPQPKGGEVVLVVGPVEREK